MLLWVFDTHLFIRSAVLTSCTWHAIAACGDLTVVLADLAYEIVEGVLDVNA